MLGNWKPPHYSTGLQTNCVTIAEALKPAGYRCYHVGKWHVGGVGGRRAAGDVANHPLDRGFDRAYGTGGGGNFFAPNPLYLDREAVKPEGDYYVTDAFSEYAAKFVQEHGRGHAGGPFLLHLCYTAPHFPLHARPEDIAKYRGKYRDGWDALRERRFARQKDLGVFPRDAKLSPRHPDAVAWADLPENDRDDWDLRMAVYAAMIDRMDQGIGRVLVAIKALGQEDNTLVVFFSDNGASAEYLDSWPNPTRGHKPGSVVGTKESHKCLEVGWANAANTPFREHKMWVHEGGIATPFIAHWPAGITAAKGSLTPAVGHVIDLMPTCLDVAGAAYPKRSRETDLTPLEGRSLLPAFRGESAPDRTLAWEHEGNRAIRVGRWKLVAAYRKPWELYDLATDRSECHDLAPTQPDRERDLAAGWQKWADRVGVVPWEQLPGASYKPSAGYRKTSERP
jgi:arylsulfatase